MNELNENEEVEEYSFDDVLTEEVVQETVEPATEEVSESVETGEGEEVDKTDTPSGPPPEAGTDPEVKTEANTMPVSAHTAARRDWQEKQDALKAELEKAKQEQEPVVDFSEDPAGAFKGLEASVDSKINMIKANLSTDFARKAFPDYDEMEKLFITEVVVDNPSLAKQVNDSANPALLAYEHAKNYKATEELKKAGGIEGLTKSITEKVTAELVAKGSLPRTLAGVSSSAVGVKRPVAEVAPYEFDD